MRKLLEDLIAREAGIREKRVLAGFDGFIDTIAKPVLISGAEKTVYFKTIEEFGKYLADHGHKSASIELDVIERRKGGNMPNFAGGMAALGVSLSCIGMLAGEAPRASGSSIDPIFLDIPGTKVSFTAAGTATALEFEDGKIFLAPRCTLAEAPWGLIENAVDKSSGSSLEDLLNADLIACLNWSELPFSGELWQGLFKKCASLFPADKTKIFFFDLSDFSRRNDGEIEAVLLLIEQFSSLGTSILSLNHNEASMLDERILQKKHPAPQARDLRETAVLLSQVYGIDEIVIHSHRESFAHAGNALYTTETVYVPAPKISTGAGDHFNAAYAFASLMGLPPQEKLRFATLCAYVYVSTGKTPTLKTLLEQSGN
jgi:hypothetical protein